MTNYELEAMPSLMDVTDFWLTDDRTNTELLNKLLARKPKLLEQRSDSTLFVTGNEQGYYFLVYDNQIVYLSRYKTINKNLVGNISVTQVAGWRSMYAPLSANGIVTETMFKYILPRFGVLMSDKIQTIRGRDLWIRLLSIAIQQKAHTALVDFHLRKVLSFGAVRELRLWDTDTSTGGAWSWDSNKHQGIRFLISKYEFPKSTPMMSELLD